MIPQRSASGYEIFPKESAEHKKINNKVQHEDGTTVITPVYCTRNLLSGVKHDSDKSAAALRNL